MASALRVTKPAPALDLKPKPLAGARAAASSTTRSRAIGDDRPAEAFRSDKAKCNGRANASAGRYLTTTPADHFGPIPKEFCPGADRGIEVGDAWRDRMDCKQYRVHIPHMAAISGQERCGAQSLVLAGKCADDVDSGDYFWHTGSGGRVLERNKRTCKIQTKHQTFTAADEALRMSCVLGLPVRVVRSHKSKRSAYAPSTAAAVKGKGVRYDGIYVCIAAFRREGEQRSAVTGEKLLVCRYLLARCDNKGAPWADDPEKGDAPGPLGIPEVPEAALAELDRAVSRAADEEPGTVGADITKDGSAIPRVTRLDPALAHWKFVEARGAWGLVKEPPRAPRCGGGNRGGGGGGGGDNGGDNDKRRRAAGRLHKAAKVLYLKADDAERVLRNEFTCGLCSKVLRKPLSLACGHHWCRVGLTKRFAPSVVDGGPTTARAAPAPGGRSLRARIVQRPCPHRQCTGDCSGALDAHGNVNLAMDVAIEDLKKMIASSRAEARKLEEQARREGGIDEAADADEEDRDDAEDDDDDKDDDDDDDEDDDEREDEEGEGAGVEPALVEAGGAPSSSLTAADRAAAALAKLKAELGLELDDSTLDSFLEEVLQGHDGNVKAASVEVRMTVEAQARAEKKALKNKKAAACASSSTAAAASSTAAAASSTAAAAAPASSTAAAAGPSSCFTVAAAAPASCIAAAGPSCAPPSGPATSLRGKRTRRPTMERADEPRRKKTAAAAVGDSTASLASTTSAAPAAGPDALSAREQRLLTRGPIRSRSPADAGGGGCDAAAAAAVGAAPAVARLPQPSKERSKRARSSDAGTDADGADPPAPRTASPRPAPSFSSLSGANKRRSLRLVEGGAGGSNAPSPAVVVVVVGGSSSGGGAPQAPGAAPPRWKKKVFSQEEDDDLADCLSEALLEQQKEGREEDGKATFISVAEKMKEKPKKWTSTWQRPYDRRKELLKRKTDAELHQHFNPTGRSKKGAARAQTIADSRTMWKAK